MTSKNEEIPPWWPSTFWPQGHYMDGTELCDLLYESANRHAHIALNNFTSDDMGDLTSAAISAGCAVEHLAKSYIASIQPVLLAEKGDRETVLHLSGKGDLAKLSITEIRTHGANEALLLARHFSSSIRYNPSEDNLVLRVRNAVLHMGFVHSNELRQAVIIMIKVVDDLLSALSKPRGYFWGDRLLPVVDGLLDAAIAETRRIVDAKLAAAKARLDDLTRDLPETISRLILAAHSGKKYGSADHDEPQQCPVCRQAGWLLCTIEDDEVEYLRDDEGFYLRVLSGDAYPLTFECPVCRLELHANELEFFDFPTEIKVRHSTIMTDDGD